MHCASGSCGLGGQCVRTSKTNCEFVPNNWKWLKRNVEVLFFSKPDVYVSVFPRLILLYLWRNLKFNWLTVLVSLSLWRSGRISDGSKLAMISSGVSRSSAGMDIPSPPVSWTTRRQLGKPFKLLVYEWETPPIFGNEKKNKSGKRGKLEKRTHASHVLWFFDTCFQLISGVGSLMGHVPFVLSVPFAIYHSFN